MTTLTAPRTAPPAVAVLALFLVSLVIGVVFTGSVYSSPFVDDGEIARHYTDNAGALRWIAFSQFLSALALLVFTAAVGERARHFPFTTPTPRRTSRLGVSCS